MLGDCAASPPLLSMLLGAGQARPIVALSSVMRIILKTRSVAPLNGVPLGIQ